MTNWTQKQSQKDAAILNKAVPEILHLLVFLVLTENEKPVSENVQEKNTVLLRKVKLLKDIIVITCISQGTEFLSFL